MFIVKQQLTATEYVENMFGKCISSQLRIMTTVNPL